MYDEATIRELIELTGIDVLFEALYAVNEIPAERRGEFGTWVEPVLVRLRDEIYSGSDR